MARCIFALAVAGLLASPAAAQHHADHVDDGVPMAAYGSVAMKTEGNTAANAAFLTGLALLHNFEYGPARRAFLEAQKADPGFVMAYWGEAMTYNHTLWATQDRDAAHRALAKLGNSPEDRRRLARSVREAEWLDAVETLYGTGDKADRDARYSAKMRKMFEASPEDIDVRAFYALSILGRAGAGRDTALYMQAAALLEEAFPANQQHPGILHYLIHSYDDPQHAPLGLRAARLYGAIARDAGHALHMTSHIYLALGMWPESIEANAAAMAAVDRSRKATGQGPTYCGHYPEWRAYSLLQADRIAEAEDILRRCEVEARAEVESGADTTRAGGVRSLYNIWAIKLVRHGIDTGEWPDFATLPQSDRHTLGRFWLAYGRVHAAGENDEDFAEARTEAISLGADALAALRDERPFDKQVPRWIERALAQIEILALHRTGETETAIEQLRAAALLEQSLPVEFGPPALPKPSWELLGDLLRSSGATQEAAAAYQEMLKTAPGRRWSLEGLAATDRVHQNLAHEGTSQRF